MCSMGILQRLIFSCRHYSFSCAFSQSPLELSGAQWRGAIPWDLLASDATPQMLSVCRSRSVKRSQAWDTHLHLAEQFWTCRYLLSQFSLMLHFEPCIQQGFRSAKHWHRALPLLQGAFAQMPLESPGPWWRGVAPWD